MSGESPILVFIECEHMGSPLPELTAYSVSFLLAALGPDLHPGLPIVFHFRVVSCFSW